MSPPSLAGSFHVDKQVHISSAMLPMDSRSTRLRVLASHLAFSILLVASLSFWVLTRWYPGGLLALQGGTRILLWVIAISVVVGPFLTFILFRPDRKQERELLLDVLLILALQFGAFGYGAWVLSIQRPTFLAFLHDRVFVITPRDTPGVIPAEVDAIPPWLNGPRPVFVRLSLGAQMEAAASLSHAEEAPPMALLPGGYAPLSEGRTRFLQLFENSTNKTVESASLLRVPIIGRAGKGEAIIDIEKAELRTITYPVEK